MIRTGGNRPEPASGATEVPAPAAARPARARPDWVPWLIAAVVLAAYLVVSLSRYLQLAPGSWDLGIFTEYVRQLAHLRAPVVNIHGPGFNLLGDHFQPIVALIVPFFLLFPSPATLLVAQALLTAVSVVPVSRAAAAMLGRGAGWAIGAAYGFSWGLAQMIDFDFHEIAFAVPLLACSLSALVRGRTRAATAVGAAAGLREGGPGIHGRRPRRRDDPRRGGLAAAGRAARGSPGGHGGRGARGRRWHRRGARAAGSGGLGGAGQRGRAGTRARRPGGPGGWAGRTARRGAGWCWSSGGWPGRCWPSW